MTGKCPVCGETYIQAKSLSGPAMKQSITFEGIYYGANPVCVFENTLFAHGEPL